MMNKQEKICRTCHWWKKKGPKGADAIGSCQNHIPSEEDGFAKTAWYEYCPGWEKNGR